MKSVIKVCNICTINDVNNIRVAVAQNNGVIACEINKEKGEVSVVYDDFILPFEKLVDCLEDKGYTVV